MRGFVVESPPITQSFQRSERSTKRSDSDSDAAFVSSCINNVPRLLQTLLASTSEYRAGYRDRRTVGSLLEHESHFICLH